MVRRRYDLEYREKLLATVLETAEMAELMARHNFSDTLVRQWARQAVKDYALAQVEVEEGVLRIDGVAVEEHIREFVRRREMPRNFTFVAEKYPTAPGCYLMKDRSGEIIYIGKAKNLRNRLSSYFLRNLDWKKTELLVGDIADIEIIIVNNESESLFLENNLIKLYKPKYNRALIRENTGFAYLTLTDEEFPKLTMYRKRRQLEMAEAMSEVAERRFGPFLNAQLLLDIASEQFQVRTCRSLPKRVCLSYHLGRCSGVCEGLIGLEEYRAAVEQTAAFLSYKPEERIREMEKAMLECAERLEFERAQKIKKRIESLQSTLEKQIVERDVRHDQDVIYFGEGHVLVTNIDGGMVSDMTLLPLTVEDGYDLACERFLVRRYGTECPDEIVVNQLSDSERVARALGEACGRKVKITVPKRGLKSDLLKLCEVNYRYRVDGNC